MNIIDNINNIIVSVLHLKEVSKLLEEVEPEVSYAMLELAQTLLMTHKVKEDDVQEAASLAADIARDKEESIQDGQ